MNFTKNKNTIQVTGSLREAWACYKDQSNLKINSGQAEETIYLNTKDRAKFCGGTIEDLEQAMTGQKDISAIIKAKEDLADIKKEFQTSMASHKSRRKRRFSEHDGDWDFDRKWDITPFAATHKMPQATKTLKITAHFAASCATQSSALDRYGAFVSALIELIEAQGITVALDWANDGANITGSRGGLGVEARVRIKEPGEYISTQALATAFSSNFLRRVGFWAIIAAAEHDKKRVDIGLGNPRNPGRAVTARQGELILSPQHNTLPDTNEVIQALKQALK